MSGEYLRKSAEASNGIFGTVALCGACATRRNPGWSVTIAAASAAPRSRFTTASFDVDGSEHVGHQDERRGHDGEVDDEEEGQIADDVLELHARDGQQRDR